MSLRNAFLILIRKFYTVGSLAVYIVGCFALIGVAGYGVLRASFGGFVELDLGNRAAAILYSIFGGSNFFSVLDSVLELLDKVVTVLSDSIGATVGVWVFLVIVVGFMGRFLLGLAELTTCGLLEMHMSINAKFSFFHMFFRNLGKNATFQLQKITITLPIDMLISYCLWLVFGLTKYDSTKLVGVFLLFIVATSLFSLRFAAVSGWAAAIVCKDGKGFKAFLHSLKVTFANFQRAWGSYITLLSIAIAVNIVVGLFTAMAGLLLSIPVSIFLFNILSMTVYYANTGKRYYIDASTVFTPG